MIAGIRSRDLYRYGLFFVLMAIMFVFMIWPILLTVSKGFLGHDGRFTLDYIWAVLNNPLYREGLINSVLIACFTTALCLVITMPLAVLATRFNFAGKAALTSLIMVPLILPPFVGAIGFRALFGRFGGFNTLLGNLGLIDPNSGFDFLGGEVGGRFWGVVLMEVLHLYPIIYLNITAALANLDPTLEEAAQSVGAGRWRRFFKVTLPLILPGIFAGATIVFIWSFTELGTPLMFDYRVVTPVQIFEGLSEVETNPTPYALVVVMLFLAVVMYLLGKYTIGGRAYTMQSKASIAGSAKRLTGLPAIGAAVAFALIIGLAVLPHIGVILSSISGDGQWYRSVLPRSFTFEHFSHALRHPMATGSIKNSLFLASFATVFSVVVGLAISYLTVRVKVRGGWMLDSLAMLPLAVPGLVMAFGYVAMTLFFPFPQIAAFFQTTLAGGNPESFWYGLGSLMQVTGQAPNPFLFLIIAYGIRRMPYVVRSASAGLEQTSGDLEDAALNLGASQATAIRRVIVPLIMANLIAGAILAFSFSMLEVSDSLILAQKETHFPITKAIFELYMRLGDGPYIASAMGVWGMALLTVTLVGASVLMGKKLGAIFRV